MTVVVGAGQLWMIGKQAGITRTQNRIVHRQTVIMRQQRRAADVQAGHMLAGLVEAKRSADAAALSADVARDTLVLTQRAYLHVTDVAIKGYGSSSPTFVISVSNYGRMQATITQWAYVFEDEDLPAIPDHDLLIHCGSGGPVLPSGAAMLSFASMLKPHP